MLRWISGPAAAAVLSGCIPPSAQTATASAPSPAPPTPIAAAPTPQRLELDLSGLKDERPVWERRPVVARPVVDGGQRFHVVASGETGIAIARAYGVPWNRIVEANALAEPFTLRVGQRLLLPGDAAATAAQSPEARAAAFQIGIDDLVTGSEPARIATAPKPRAPTPVSPVAPARFVWPASGGVVLRFGPVANGRINQGIDIATAPGAGVRAASGGTVAYVGSVPGFGGLILVRHDGGWISAYGRIASASVAKGDSVSSGQTIGKSTGEPLHFELRKSRVPVDPVRYLPVR